MKIRFVQQFIRLSFVVAFALLNFSCEEATNTPGAPNQKTVIEGPINAQTPTEAYKSLYAAVKARDNQRIQKLMSRNTMAFAGFAIEQNKQSLEKFFENGLTATTFADNLPEIRDERVNGNFAAVEVFSQKDNRWEDLPFVLEDGMWKLAVGDSFKGEYKSPGKGQAQIEMEANNPAMIDTTASGASGNSNSKTEIPKDKSKRNPVNTAEVSDEDNGKSAVNANKK